MVLIRLLTEADCDKNESLINARRGLLQARRLRYSIISDLHNFMVAVSRIIVNHDGHGGTAPPTPKFGTMAAFSKSALLPLDLWSILLLSRVILTSGPHSVNIHLKFAGFPGLSSLHWSQRLP